MTVHDHAIKWAVCLPENRDYQVGILVNVYGHWGNKREFKTIPDAVEFVESYEYPEQWLQPIVGAS